MCYFSELFIEPKTKTYIMLCIVAVDCCLSVNVGSCDSFFLVILLVVFLHFLPPFLPVKRRSVEVNQIFFIKLLYPVPIYFSVFVNFDD